MKNDLSEYTSVLLTLIAALAHVGGFLFWRLISDIRDRIKALTELQAEFMKTCFANHASLVEKFLTRVEWLDWQKGREEIKEEREKLRDEFNYHGHADSGKVVRNNK